jgi:alanine-synthesizing transaminase
MTPRILDQSTKLKDVLYEIRGAALVEADRLEADGHRILKLNTGNPAIFGFEAPYQIVRDMIEAVPHAHGYSDSRGIMSARRAVVSRYEQVAGFPKFDPDDVYLGNGVSELITMTMQALLDTGDEVLIPAPDYPLWTAMTSLAGGTPVHYLCDNEDGWQPSLDDIRAKITERTKAIVVINPNNPTGAVYSREVLQGIVEIAREHELLLLSDEIYDRILFDDAQHIPLATLGPPLPHLQRPVEDVPRGGYRSGWMVITGPKRHAAGSCRASSCSPRRACARMSRRSTRCRRRCRGAVDRRAHRADGTAARAAGCRVAGPRGDPRVTCHKPAGRCTRSRASTPRCTRSTTTRSSSTTSSSRSMLLVQGTGFNWPTPDHLRIVTLPEARVLTEAIERLGNFLASYRQ